MLSLFSGVNTFVPLFMARLQFLPKLIFKCSFLIKKIKSLIGHHIFNNIFRRQNGIKTWRYCS